MVPVSIRSCIAIAGEGSAMAASLVRVQGSHER